MGAGSTWPRLRSAWRKDNASTDATQKEVKGELPTWAAQRNAHHDGTDRRFTTKDARIKLKRLYP